MVCEGVEQLSSGVGTLPESPALRSAAGAQPWLQCCQLLSASLPSPLPYSAEDICPEARSIIQVDNTDRYTTIIYLLIFLSGSSEAVCPCTGCVPAEAVIEEFVPCTQSQLASS